MGRKRVWALCAAFGLVLLTAGAVWAAQAPPPEPGESVEGESVEKDERAERIEVSWRPAAGQSSGDVHIFRSLRKRHSFDWHQGGFGLRTALGRGEPGFQLLYRQSGKSATEFNIQVGVVYRVRASVHLPFLRRRRRPLHPERRVEPAFHGDGIRLFVLVFGVWIRLRRTEPDVQPIRLPHTILIA